MTLAELEARVGGLSRPSKLPGYGWSISAKRCKLGSILRTKAGSTCSICYALKGRYVFSTAQRAMEVRYQKMKKHLGKWTEHMVELINARVERPSKARKRRDVNHFRWFDSGDLQSVEHLEAIAEIARQCPDVKFWLPTREGRILNDWKRNHNCPRNLCIRRSAQTVGAGWTTRIRGANTSTVDSGQGYRCPAPDQGNQCGDCRACWDRSVPNVDYRKH